MVMSATMATMPVMLMQIVPTLLVLIFVLVKKGYIGDGVMPR